MSTGPLGTNLSEIQIEIQNFPFAKMHLKMSSAKSRPFCPGESNKPMTAPMMTNQNQVFLEIIFMIN